MNRFERAFGLIPFWIVFACLHILLGVLLVAVLLPCSRKPDNAAAMDERTPAVGIVPNKRNRHPGFQRLSPSFDVNGAALIVSRNSVLSAQALYPCCGFYFQRVLGKTK
jgi:hypothetical protein